MDLAKSGIKVFVGRTSGAIIQFIGVVYFARILGPSGVGVFFLFQATAEIISTLADMGLRGALEKRISEGDSRGQYFLATILLKGSILAIVSPILFVFRADINEYLGADLAILLIFSIILQEILRLFVFVLKGELRVGETAILMVSQKIIWVLGGALLVNLGFQAKSLILSLILSFAIPTVWGWKKLSITPKRPSNEHFRSIFNYGKFSAVSSFGDIFYNWIDLAIIGLFLTEADVGAYEIAWRISGVVVLLSSSVATTILPQISRWSIDGETDQIESMVRAAIIPSMFLPIPSFFGVVLLSEEILNFIFGAEFGFASLVLIILISEKIIFSAHVIFKQALMGVDRPDIAAYSTMISSVINILLNIGLIQRYGIVGAACATTLSFIVNTYIHLYFLNRMMNVKFPFAEIGWCLASAIVMALMLFGLKQLIAVSSISVLFLYVFVGASIYLALSFLFPPLRGKIVNQIYRLRPS